MIRQILIEAESPDDAQSTFRLSINANIIATCVTVAQAYYLVGEVLSELRSRNALTRSLSTQTSVHEQACTYPRRRLKFRGVTRRRKTIVLVDLRTHRRTAGEAMYLRIYVGCI